MDRVEARSSDPAGSRNHPSSTLLPGPVACQPRCQETCDHHSGLTCPIHAVVVGFVILSHSIHHAADIIRLNQPLSLSLSLSLVDLALPVYSFSIEIDSPHHLHHHHHHHHLGLLFLAAIYCRRTPQLALVWWAVMAASSGVKAGRAVPYLSLFT